MREIRDEQVVAFLEYYTANQPMNFWQALQTYMGAEIKVDGHTVDYWQDIPRKV